MIDEQAVRAYFGQPGFARLLDEADRQYRSSRLGVRGYAKIEDVTDDERRTLDGFYGTYTPGRPGVPERYSLKKFDELLRASKYGLSLPELLTLLRGEPVRTRREREDREREEWRAMIRSAMAAAEIPPGSGPVSDWAARLFEEDMPAARVLRPIFARSAEEASVCLVRCLLALKRVIGSGAQPIRLPILAALTAGDAHALDWKQPAGRLFWAGLTMLRPLRPASFAPDGGEDLPKCELADSSQAIVIREGYRRGGVADDDLSSQAMLYAPALFGCREERVLTLRQVERLESNSLASLRCDTIFMVENPSIFAELIDADAAREQVDESRSPIVICGNGQPTTAVLKLLDALLAARAGTVLLYGGDLDPAGLSIAGSLHTRYRSAFRAWRMDRDQHARYSARGIPMIEQELARLRDVTLNWSPDLAQSMLDSGMKLHQELWAAELVEDLLRTCRGHTEE